MTLIVSLRIPDGIVLAGDSLATMNNNLQINADLEVQCPQCNHKHHISQTLGNVNIPATTLSYAQKVFPFLSKYGVGVFGQSILASKSIGFLMKSLEADLKHKPITQQPKNVSDVARHIQTYIEKAVVNHVDEAKKAGIDVDKVIPAKSILLGCQVVGYDTNQPKTIALHFAREKTTVLTFEDLNLSVSGDNQIFNGLEKFYQSQNKYIPVYPLFSLQDAIEYSEFVIHVTANIQHFSSSMATVGGDIDIILVTPFEEYRWIKQKSLQSRLIGGHSHHV